ncbi:MAG: DNA starvation/stationary phase protection protein [Gammaproteobacteria bacterium]|nr:DNA starvation/stationary phase protection protein [Gammaproteobacteria bacterium]
MDNESKVVRDLRHLLADTYVLYTKTQNFHWNVTGELFFMLHAAFEKQYEALADAVDVLAERLRALNVVAPGTFTKFEKLAGIKFDDEIPPAQEMIRELLANHEHLIDELQSMIKNAEEEGDQSTMDLMIERQTEHQKTAWMLRSSLNAQ